MPSSQPSQRRGRLEAHEKPVALHGIFDRLHLAHLLERYPDRPIWASFMFLNGFLSVGVMALLAMVTRSSLVFPSLGPTAFLFFFAPQQPGASPRNALYGHAIGILCGYGALAVCGLATAPSAMQEGVNLPRVVAAALSLAATGAVMILLKAPHPPAGATTLIISLGLITRPLHLLEIEGAVALLALQAIAINRLAGLRYPLWSQRPDSPDPLKVATATAIKDDREHDHPQRDQ